MILDVEGEAEKKSIQWIDFPLNGSIRQAEAGRSTCQIMARGKKLDQGGLGRRKRE